MADHDTHEPHAHALPPDHQLPAPAHADEAHRLTDGHEHAHEQDTLDQAIGGAGAAAPLATEAGAAFALRMMYDEQRRMREELEAMRKKAAEKGGKDKEGGDDKEDGDKKDDEEDKPKPPLKERLRATRDKVRNWVRQHPVWTVVIVVVFLLLILGAILLVHYLNSYVDTDDAFIDGHTDPISFRISGIVKAVYVENTSHVKKGQLMVELDRRDNQVAKEQASANYEQAKAGTRAQAPNVPITAVNQVTAVSREDLNVVSARANVNASEERYRSALADLHQAEANLGNAQREEERYRQLVVKEEVTREQYDQRYTNAQAQAEIVSSRRSTADATGRTVTQARAQLGQALAQAAQAKADTPQQIQMQREMLAQRKAAELVAKAQADQAQLNLEYTRIYAPEDGIVGDKQVQVATQVAPGQELFALTQTNDVWVTANFKETEIARMHAGQGVTIHVDALDLDFHGYIEALPGASGAVYSLLPPENATGNYVKVVQRLPIRIRFNPNQNGFQRLRPGMSVEPKVWLR